VVSSFECRIAHLTFFFLCLGDTAPLLVIRPSFRGFRQATRGPDTGAFHHALFRRDQPELCLGMVCQRSRDRRSAGAADSSSASAKKGIKQGNTLPPKKGRQTAAKVSALTEDSLEAINQSSQLATPKVATVSVSSDCSSEAGVSCASSNTGAQLASMCVSNNQAFVRSVIQQRNEIERLRVAKTLLYQAYTDALQSGGFKR